MKGLDLSKFKKVSSDKNCTILKHSDGHELKIAHEGLSPKMRQELTQLPMHKAKGGKVQRFDAGGMTQGIPADNTEQVQGSTQTVSAEPEMTGMYDPSEEEDAATSAPSIQDKWNATYQKTLQSMRNQNYSHYDDAKLQKDAEVATANQLGAAKDAQDAQAQQMNQVTNQDAALQKQMQDQSYQQNLARVTDINAQRNKIGLPPLPLPTDPNAPATAASTANVTKPLDDTSPASVSDDTSTVSSQPAQDPSPVMPQVAQQPVKSTPEQTMEDYKNVVTKNMLDENKKWEDDLVNGHVTPETYQSLFAKKDTLGKVGTMFGLLMAGAGSGLTHQPNAVLQMMGQQIDNDLKAQIQSKQNAYNFNNLTQQHEMQRSQQGLIGVQTAQAQYNLSKMRMNSVALHSLVQQVNKLNPNTPQGQQARQQLAMLYNQVQGENYNLADKAAAADAYTKFMGFSPNGGSNPGSEEQFQHSTQLLKSGMMGPAGVERGKDLESKHIPGFSGLASEAINPTAKAELSRKAEFDNQLQRYKDWASQHSGILPDSPQNIAIIKQGQTLARQLQSTYREAALNTVYRQSEAPLLDQTIDSDPTKFLNKWRVLPQINTLQQENRAQLNDAGHALGLGDYKGLPGTHQSSQQEEIRYDAKGNAWKKGPNGKPVRVK